MTAPIRPSLRRDPSLTKIPASGRARNHGLIRIPVYVIVHSVVIMVSTQPKADIGEKSIFFSQRKIILTADCQSVLIDVVEIVCCDGTVSIFKRFLRLVFVVLCPVEIYARREPLVPPKNIR